MKVFVRFQVCDNGSKLPGGENGVQSERQAEEISKVLQMGIRESIRASCRCGPVAPDSLADHLDQLVRKFTVNLKLANPEKDQYVIRRVGKTTDGQVGGA